MPRRLSGPVLLLASVLSALLAVTLVAPAEAVGLSEASTSSTSVAPARAGARPAVLGVRVIGRSVKGRPIKAWHLGDPDAEVTAVLLATMHGNEAGPAAILRNLRDGRPISGANIWVVPTLNPDGQARHTRKNARGVDLNRNFPVRWVRQYGNYDSGRKPASEPETRALMGFLKDVRPTYVVSMHQPLYGVDSSYRGKVRPLARRLARHLDLPRKRFTCNSGCHGTMTQWFNRRLAGAAITVEYGARMSSRQKYRTGPRGLLRSVRATR